MCKRIGIVISFLVIEIDLVIKVLELFLYYRCLKGRIYNRFFYISYKLSFKFLYRFYSYWFNENK